QATTSSAPTSRTAQAADLDRRLAIRRFFLRAVYQAVRESRLSRGIPHTLAQPPGDNNGSDARTGRPPVWARSGGGTVILNRERHHSTMATRRAVVNSEPPRAGVPRRFARIQTRAAGLRGR